MPSNFVAEVKERDVGQPCFLWLNTHDDIGLGQRAVLLTLPEGTGIAEAERLRDALRASGASIRLST
jgi:hypothetical protein